MINTKNILDNCTGCGLCVSLINDENFRMNMSSQGFLRPNLEYIKNDRKKLKLFENFCPGINSTVSLLENQASQTSKWGSYFDILQGHADSEKIRWKGSSGGVLTALSSFLLDSHKVDCVIATCADANDPTLNRTIWVDKSNNMLECASSRYAPSDPLTSLKKAFESYDTICVIGKPCDIVGVRNYLKLNKSDYLQKKVFLFSFFCAGVPSQNATNDLLKELNIDKESIVSLKYRGEGWPGMFKVETTNGLVFQKDYESSWGQVLGKKLQPRCKICLDGIGETADIVCFDHWETDEKGFPLFSDSNGKSGILTRTHLGKSILEEAIREGYITITYKIEESELSLSQPYQTQRRERIPYSLLALRFLGRKVPKYNPAVIRSIYKSGNWKTSIKTFIGTILRALTGKM